MSMNHISEHFRLEVLIRLLKDDEQFTIACSKSGLPINIAKKLLDNQ
jgi:hypothetical protein